MLTVPNVGRAALLKLLTQVGLTLELYTNDVKPGPDDTTATYHPPVGGGYIPHKLAPKNWSFKGGQMVGAEQVFTFTAVPKPNLIHGYFVRLGSILMWVEPFDSPFPVNLKGDTVVVVPTLTL